MVAKQQKAVRQRDLHAWPRYEAAAPGLRNYWYPVTWSRVGGRKPQACQLRGEPLMLLCEGGHAYAFRDQGPQRGILLSAGRQDFPSSWSCRCRGWIFDLGTGGLRARRVPAMGRERLFHSEISSTACGRLYEPTRGSPAPEASFAEQLVAASVAVEAAGAPLATR